MEMPSVCCLFPFPFSLFPFPFEYTSTMTRRFLLSALGLVGLSAGTRLGAQAPRPSASTEKSAWYFYRVKWGHQAEFEDLFRRNHWPVLMEQQKRGRISGVKV